MWRIKQLVYDFSPLFQEFARTDETAPHAMLVPLPGSQHTLGLFMVSEFFRRGGWKVWGELAASEADIVTAIKTQHFDLVGLSVSTEDQLPALARFVAQYLLLNPNFAKRFRQISLGLMQKNLWRRLSFSWKKRKLFNPCSFLLMH
jgi:hypothetical protein